MADYSPGDSDMLQRLASRFDPRVVYPDLLAKRAFDRFAAIFGLLEVDLQSIRRLAGWRSEDWPTCKESPSILTGHGNVESGLTSRAGHERGNLRPEEEK